MSEVERHEMPNGDVVFYRDSDHAYWREFDGKKCSGRIPGVSTVSKNSGDTNTDPLMDWAVRLAYSGVAQEAALGLSLEDAEDMQTALSWLSTGEAIENTLRAEKLLWRDVRDEKGRIGGLSHGVLQALAEGATPILRNGYDQAVADWWSKRQPETLDSERVTFSASHEFAGRFDVRARIHGDVVAPYAIPDLAGKVALADAKVSGFISNSFHIQLSGYELANEECGIGTSDVQLILQLRENGDWHEWRSHAIPADFLCALNIYLVGKRIRSGAGKDWRRWKDAQKVAA